MTREAEDALARKAASDALGHPVSDYEVGYALAGYVEDATEDLVERLAAMSAEAQKDHHRRQTLNEEIDNLKIVLAVRAAVPPIAIRDEIRINTRQWPTREASTLTVSLDRLASVLAEECPTIDTADLARLMASLCLRAAGGVDGDALLAQKEAGRYVPEDDDDDDSL